MRAFGCDIELNFLRFQEATLFFRGPFHHFTRPATEGFGVVPTTEGFGVVPTAEGFGAVPTAEGFGTIPAAGISRDSIVAREKGDAVPELLAFFEHIATESKARVGICGEV